MSIKMELVRVLIRETDDTHVVELREVDGERIFPIVIGFHEAAAIERRLMGQTPPRPQTHELLASAIEHLGGRIERVLINDLKDHTFYARLLIRQGDTMRDIDAPPQRRDCTGRSHRCADLRRKARLRRRLRSLKVCDSI